MASFADGLEANEYVTCAIDGRNFMMQVAYIDDTWVYLRAHFETEVNYKARRSNGELRKFMSDSWEKIDANLAVHYTE